MKIPLLLLALCFTVPSQPQPLNLITYGDSLTEGIPHLNGEADTYPFMVGQQFTASTYVKLGYRGQTTDFLKQHLDSFLFTMHKDGYFNVLVLWAGTNDCAYNLCSQVLPNLEYMATVAKAAGWSVVVATVIDRRSYLTYTTRTDFETQVAAINDEIRKSKEFDAVADVAPLLSDADNGNLFWDGCHLLPQGYRLVADAVVRAILQLEKRTNL